MEIPLNRKESPPRLRSRSSKGFSEYLGDLHRLHNSKVSIKNLWNLAISREFEISQVFGFSYRAILRNLRRYVSQERHLGKPNLSFYPTYQRLFDLWVIKYLSGFDSNEMETNELQEDWSRVKYVQTRKNRPSVFGNTSKSVLKSPSVSAMTPKSKPLVRRPSKFKNIQFQPLYGGRSKPAPSKFSTTPPINQWEQKVEDEDVSDLMSIEDEVDSNEESDQDSREVVLEDPSFLDVEEPEDKVPEMKAIPSLRDYQKWIRSKN